MSDLGGTITPSAMRRTLARARDGKPLDLDEATVLLHARGDDLNRLLEYAGRTRDAGLEAALRPKTITYSRKVFIPLTRLCRDRCGYCVFATTPGRVDSPYLSPDEVLAIAREGAAHSRVADTAAFAVLDARCAHTSNSTTPPFRTLTAYGTHRHH